MLNRRSFETRPGSPSQPQGTLRRRRCSDHAGPRQLQVHQRHARASRRRRGDRQDGATCSPRACARPTCSPGSAATSSRCCCPMPTPRRAASSPRICSEALRAEVVEIGLHARPLAASAGIALCESADGPSGEDVLVNADLAMYDAKNAGRDRAELYTAGEPSRLADERTRSPGPSRIGAGAPARRADARRPADRGTRHRADHPARTAAADARRTRRANPSQLVPLHRRTTRNGAGDRPMGHHAGDRLLAELATRDRN